MSHDTTQPEPMPAKPEAPGDQNRSPSATKPKRLLRQMPKLPIPSKNRQVIQMSHLPISATKQKRDLRQMAKRAIPIQNHQPASGNSGTGPTLSLQKGGGRPKDEDQSTYLGALNDDRRMRINRSNLSYLQRINRTIQCYLQRIKTVTSLL